MVIAQSLAKSRFATARWLVLAPHADDETLGAGALVAETAAAGRLAGIVYLTDGAASHPGGGGRLARLRRREAGLAMRRLGVAATPVFLGWPDAHPHRPDSAAWRSTVRALAALIRSRRVDAVAVTGAEERHCDHAAFQAIASAAVRAARRSVALFEYRVWSDPALRHARRTLRTCAMPPGMRRHALMAHRSQTSAAFGPGFRVARAAWRMPATDVLHLNGAHHVH
ncbi:PIG-L family deacetylase [Sphingomonas sp. SUN019]|uniref:PIG-L deacetylase family protein n=1 Tax=Sphingomonas sp. SUN019 TaxID=2937788 RepID=UPI00216413E2|nr:PIG-L family deacetylase [Sphingomonas sp. SUN019]UVO50117.1 PIG-L family deacetylase [Sphingomonas sp. SUN019]